MGPKNQCFFNVASQDLWLFIMALFSSSSELLNQEFVDYTCSFEYLSVLWLETNCMFIKLRQLIRWTRDCFSYVLYSLFIMPGLQAVLILYFKRKSWFSSYLLNHTLYFNLLPSLCPILHVSVPLFARVKWSKIVILIPLLLSILRHLT